MTGVTRKIQQVGGGTYMVSVPKEWGDSIDIDAWDEVYVQRHIDGTLVIKPPDYASESSSPVEVEADEFNREKLEIVIRSAYAAGVRVIELRVAESKTDAEKYAVDDILRRLVGLTADDVDGVSVTIRSLVDHDEVSVRQTLRQLVFLVLKMYRQAIANVDNPDHSRESRSNHAGVERLQLLIARNFRRSLSDRSVMDQLGLTREELLDAWVAAQALHFVPVEVERIVLIANELNCQLDSTITEKLHSAGRLTRQVIEDRGLRDPR
jgi:phosphate uptake regulator